MRLRTSVIQMCGSEETSDPNNVKVNLKEIYQRIIDLKCFTGLKQTLFKLNLSLTFPTDRELDIRTKTEVLNLRDRKLETSGNFEWKKIDERTKLDFNFLNLN